MPSIAENLKRSLSGQVLTRKEKATFYYGAICALAFSGHLDDAKSLAEKLGVNIDNVTASVR